MELFINVIIGVGSSLISSSFFDVFTPKWWMLFIGIIFITQSIRSDKKWKS